MNDELLEPDEDMTFTLSDVMPAAGVIATPSISFGIPNTQVVIITDADGQYNNNALSLKTSLDIVVSVWGSWERSLMII